MKFDLDDLNLVLAGQQDALTRFVDVATPLIQSRVARALRRRSYQAAGRPIRQEVEDLTQEVFVSLFADGAKTLRSWDPSRGLSLESFIVLVADRQTASILRTGKRNPWTEDPTLGEDLERQAAVHQQSGEQNFNPTSTLPEGQVANSEMLRQIVDRLEERLSPLGMRLFELVCVEQQSVKEICAEMQMSRDAVYGWRSRLVRLAREIHQELLSEMKGVTRRRTMGANTR